MRFALTLAAVMLSSTAVGCRFWSVRPIIEEHLRDAGPALDASDEREPERDAGPPLDAGDARTSDASRSCSIDNGGCGPSAEFDCLEGAPLRCALRCEPDRRALLQGIARFDTRNFLFSPIIVHGDNACPLMVTPGGRPFAAFARDGLGRVVWLGHDATLTTLASQPDGSTLLRNALLWGTRRASLTGIRVGLEPNANLAAITSLVSREGGSTVPVVAGMVSNATIDAWVTASTQAPTTDEERNAVRAFVARGGLLLHAGQAWNWARTRPNDPASNYPGNALIPSAGMLLVPQALAATETAVGATVLATDLSHARRALDRTLAHLRNERTLSSSEQPLVALVLADAVEQLPFDLAWWSAARALITGPLPTPTRDQPVIAATQPIDAVRLLALGRINRAAPDAWIARAAASDDFPGASAAASERITVTIDGDAPASDARYLYAETGAKLWRSTGVYARPGHSLRVSLAPRATSLGLEVLVGMHDRVLTAEPQWERVPSIARALPLREPEQAITSAFGGLVYVLVPAGIAAGPIDVTIDGGSRAPAFVRGRTTIGDWRAAIGASATPWTELISARATLTIPLSAARTITEPDALMSHWDAVVAAMAELAGTPLASLRPEQIVFDRQLPGGATGTAGYPLVRQIDRASLATDLPTLRTDGEWGTYVLLGRRFQSRDWLIPGAQDATNALFSLYALDRVCGRGIANSPYPPLAPLSRSTRIDTYVNGGRNYGRDFNGLVALEMYLQLVEAFGWAAFRQLVHEYQALPEAERPATDDARVQQWAIRSSRVFNRDLSPFYGRWGLPLSASTRTATAMYPMWTEAPARP